MNYHININKHSGLSWSIDINKVDYDVFKKFILELLETNYTHLTKKNFGFHNGYKNRINDKDMKSMDLLLTDDGKKYFSLIKEFLSVADAEESFEIKEISSYQRMIIYLICKTFGLTYMTIKTTKKVLVPCTDFLPCNKGLPRDKHQTKDIFRDEIVCGCDFAPSWFSRNHHDNNYEDTICYSYTYRSMKTGVKIIKICAKTEDPNVKTSTKTKTKTSTSSSEGPMDCKCMIDIEGRFGKNVSDQQRILIWKGRHCKDCLLCYKKWQMKLITAEQGCYMLRNEIWDLASKVRFGIALCENCFEKRLGRPLTNDDYSTAPVNWESKHNGIILD